MTKPRQILFRDPVKITQRVRHKVYTYDTRSIHQTVGVFTCFLLSDKNEFEHKA